MEKLMEKGEIAHLQQFRPLPKCFPEAFFFSVLKMRTYGGKG